MESHTLQDAPSLAREAEKVRDLQGRVAALESHEPSIKLVCATCGDYAVITIGSGNVGNIPLTIAHKALILEGWQKQHEDRNGGGIPIIGHYRNEI